MKEYKLYFKKIKSYLKDSSLKLSEEKLDALIEKELEKPAGEMDSYLIDLCLNALVAYRKSKE